MLKEIIDTPEKLGNHTPSEWKQVMIDEGRMVTPLSNWNYKGIPFESGGGYKTNFEDGDLYFPENYENEEDMFKAMLNEITG